MFGDMGKILKLMGKLKTELPALQERLASSEYRAISGNGAVTATVNGRLALIDLQLDPSLLPHSELATAVMEDLVKAAVAAAQKKAMDAAHKAMLELTGGEELPPGLEGML